MKVGTNAAVFVLFFGMALMEAFEQGNWITAAVWLAIGVVFLLGDNSKPKPKAESDEHGL
jgi:hypothetical protein